MPYRYRYYNWEKPWKLLDTYRNENMKVIVGIGTIFLLCDNSESSIMAWYLYHISRRRSVPRSTEQKNTHHEGLKSGASKLLSDRAKQYWLITSIVNAMYADRRLTGSPLSQKPPSRPQSLSTAECRTGSSRVMERLEKNGLIHARRVRWSSWEGVEKVASPRPNIPAYRGGLSVFFADPG